MVAEHRALAGIVVDPEGAALPGANIFLELPGDLRARIDDVAVERTEVQRFSAVADAAGRFRFRARPFVEGAVLEVLLEGYVTTPIQPPAAPTQDFVIEMVPFEAPQGWLTGRVVDPANAPVAGAHVALGSMAQMTDEAGQFRFPMGDFEPQDELVAISRGYLPARLEGVSRADGGFAWPEWVELRLEGEPLSITGRVLDERGAPAHPAWVWIADATPFARGAQWPIEIETELAGTPRMWSTVATDVEGRFELPGLLDRSYTLRAVERATILVTELAKVPAGARDVELRMPADALHPRLSVRVTDRLGAPLEGVQVGITRDVHTTVTQQGRRFAHSADGVRVRTDEQGRAELPRVPRECVELVVQAEGFLRRNVDVEALDAAGEIIELVLWRSCPVHVDLGPGGLEADELVLLDPAGDELVSRWRVEQTYHLNARVPLVEGRQSFTAPDAAVTAVFFLGGSEVLRVPLELSAEEQNRIHP